MAATENLSPAAYEDKHVHQVYEQIASHFSETRHKPWPVVHRFLIGLRPGSLGLDVGCGNGKYLSVNRDVFIIASDRSPSLIDIAAQQAHHAAIIADTLHLPHPSDTFDFAISIAVIHHLSSRARRIDAIREIVRILRRSPAIPDRNLPGSYRANMIKRPESGRALIFAWALEQKGSRRGWDRGDKQDVLVPWVLKQGGRSEPGEFREPKLPKAEMPANAQNEQKRSEDGLQSKPTTFQRYYHLYAEGELQSEVEEAGATVVERGYDKDNWWVVLQPCENE